MPRLIKAALALISLASLCLIYGFFIEPKILKIRDVSIASPNYEGAALRIALLSDIHIGGRHISAKRVEIISARINALNPDIILIPGDFINGHKPRMEHDEAFNTEIRQGLEALAALEAPLGVFASIGNHDVWYDADFIEDKLNASGITVLRNRAANLPNGLCIIGFADHDTERDDDANYSDCESSQVPIAVMHSPDSFPLLRSDTALAVAGHTHGGQINIPLIGRRVTSTSAGRRYAYGLVDVNGIPAFVTAGIGTSILPARFRAPPEIVLVTLKPL